MGTHSVIGLFCDDLREEVGGKETVLGVYPDSLSVPGVPGALPKLCFYVRIHLNVEFIPQSVTVRLNRPDDAEGTLAEIEQDVISKAVKEAKKSGHPYAGLISRAIIAPFPVLKIGRFDIVVCIDGQDEICGSLLIKLNTPQE